MHGIKYLFLTQVVSVSLRGHIELLGFFGQNLVSKYKNFEVGSDST